VALMLSLWICGINWAIVLTRSAPSITKNARKGFRCGLKRCSEAGRDKHGLDFHSLLFPTSGQKEQKNESDNLRDAARRARFVLTTISVLYWWNPGPAPASRGWRTRPRRSGGDPVDCTLLRGTALLVLVEFTR